MREDFKISYSRVNTYLFCPQKYKLVYLDNLKGAQTADMAFGLSIHKTLECFHSQGVGSFEALIDCYNANWVADGFQTPQDVYSYYERGKEMLKNYFSSFENSDSKVLFSEKKFDANIGKYRFIGIIDRVDIYPDKTKELIDYKTHATVWTQERLDSDMQLSFYAYACKNVLGFVPDKICAYFLSENKKVYTSRTQTQMEEAINEAIEVAELIATEDFSPDTTKCAMCDFKNKCKYSGSKEEEK
ncbi:MAG: PD-(D/E)XK nuclease family protein [Elusimicrobia bacterium]|nr:PD-(D/E)XK nuclease family protein [Elusimicrobiota bacterium]